MKNHKYFSSALRELLAEIKITQREFSKRIGVEPAMLSKQLSGRRTSPKTLLQACDPKNHEQRSRGVDLAVAALKDYRKELGYTKQDIKVIPIDLERCAPASPIREKTVGNVKIVNTWKRCANGTKAILYHSPSWCPGDTGENGRECKSCDFFDEAIAYFRDCDNKFVKLDKGPYGICRINPPVVGPAPWPEIGWGDWCGKYKPRKGRENEE